MTLFLREAEGLRQERMMASPQYRDGRFFNPYPSSSLAVGQQPRPDLKAFLFGGRDRVPKAALPSLDPRPQWVRPPRSGLRATWLGHATVLLEIDGRVVLTDPVWGKRASPLSFLGPKRFQPVPVAVAALPKLDAVLISHDHYDHLDHGTIRALVRRDVPFITSLGVGMHLEAWGVPPERITELDWWDSTDLCPGLTITATPAHHFSGRSLKGRNTTLWSSFVLQGDRHSVFFSGDSGLSPHFAEIGRRRGSFDLVMMEVGAYHSSWASVHLGPDNALEAWRQIGSGRFLPIHWGTFNLAMHPWYEPAEVLLAAKPDGLIMPRLGQATEPARAERPEPWWRPATGEAAMPVCSRSNSVGQAAPVMCRSGGESV